MPCTISYNTDRDNLVAIGDSALYNNGTGAIYTYHASYNTAIGYHSARLNTTGYRNVALGRESLCNNETGDYNTALGYASGTSAISTDLNNTTSIGNAAYVTASNTIHIGNTSITEIAGQGAFSI